MYQKTIEQNHYLIYYMSASIYSDVNKNMLRCINVYPVNVNVSFFEKVLFTTSNSTAFTIL